ncbi:ComEC/Rec2 family competence protein [Pseudarthrobacter sp. L19]|uniref:ComEC/Rec2 family competence protein n=1 Tax=Pseudarthrobacter sp. L19 TaxID=3423951 RepID=UPI003D79D47F
MALAGLALFVALVGPDASVLRAACMGAIGLAAVAAGQSGQALSLLCTAVIVLLLFDPGLAGDFGFLLSVLATLGIIVAGRPVMTWFPPAVPRAVAAGVAVPFSAQLFCGPVIVLLQPSFSTYALAANLAAAALVAPVTLLGTAAVPLLAVSPALASVPMALAGIFAAGVGAVARIFAGLPGAALVWPEGGVGASTMVLLSVLTLGAAWLLCHPVRAWRLMLAMHGRTVRLLALVVDGREWAPRGLAVRRRRGTLRVCKPTLRRNHQWLLPKTHAPRPRPRTPPPGGT